MVAESSSGEPTQLHLTGPQPSVAPGPYQYDESVLGQAESVFDTALGMDQQPPAAAAPTAKKGRDRGPSMSLWEERRRVRLEARRVRRVIRHIEPWSVLKISVIFYLCMWLIVMLAGLLLWSLAESSGALSSIEDLIENLFTLDAEEEFWQGDVIFSAYARITAFLAIAGVAFNVLLCVMYNLLSDLLGGIRLTVIEEESARFTKPRR